MFRHFNTCIKIFTKNKIGAPNVVMILTITGLYLPVRDGLY